LRRLSRADRWRLNCSDRAAAGGARSFTFGCDATRTQPAKSRGVFYETVGVAAGAGFAGVSGYGTSLWRLRSGRDDYTTGCNHHVDCWLGGCYCSSNGVVGQTPQAIVAPAAPLSPGTFFSGGSHPSSNVNINLGLMPAFHLGCSTTAVLCYIMPFYTTPCMRFAYATASTTYINALFATWYSPPLCLPVCWTCW
jgi:hypothetical protein